MRKSVCFSLVMALLLASPLARAFFSPVSISVVPPLQFPTSDFSITGVRVSGLWGQHRDIYGIDVGALGSITEQEFVGLGVSGLFNATYGVTRVLFLQAAGLTNVNMNKTSVLGLQLAGAVNYNSAAASVMGLQAALLANLSAHTDIYGFQVGLYNRAQNVYGFQVGLINVAESLHGIQIGLVNINRKGLFTVSPVVNIGF